MINFVVCDDNKNFSRIMKTIIEKVMINYEQEYKIVQFEEYDSKFEEYIRKDLGFNVYFLDIKTKHGSGLDAARIIREKYDDWVSILIIVTSHEEYRYEALSNRLYLMDFINKLDNCEEKVIEDIKKSMNNYNKRYKSLTYEYNHIFHKIEFRNIISIEKEPESKRCIIKTTYGKSYIQGTLNQVKTKLDKRFIKVHRSLIINKDKITKFDRKNNEIEFIDGTHTTNVARDKKKELLGYDR
ncbi:MAG: response regulator transcription factor [Bacilli bacterium]|nr:response regulator transcription factor [Bacilli bacterium]